MNSMHGAHSTEKVPVLIDCKLFLKGVVSMFGMILCIELLYCVAKCELVWT